MSAATVEVWVEMACKTCGHGENDHSHRRHECFTTDCVCEVFVYPIVIRTEEPK